MKVSAEAFENRLKSIWLDLTKKIQVVHKLDYPPHPIYMCDNVRLGSCQKEPETVRWIESFKKGDVAYDIGANVGAYALLMGLYADKVYAFEPAVMNFSLLCRNIIENVKRKTLANNIAPFNIALANKTSINSLNYVNLNPGKSGHQIDGRHVDGFGKNFEPAYQHEVLSLDLDFLIETFHLQNPNHIKIDVDGIELDILRGAGKTLADPRLKSVWVEIEKRTQNETEITRLLESKGLRFKEKSVSSEPIYNYHFVRTS